MEVLKMDRYAGKPFLRLLECYVLHAIGRLDPTQAATLARMEPKLREVYGMQGSWTEIVDAQMQFPESLAGRIRATWESNVAAAPRGAVLDPNEFAIAFVNQNFPDAVS